MVGAGQIMAVQQPLLFEGPKGVTKFTVGVEGESWASSGWPREWQTCVDAPWQTIVWPIRSMLEAGATRRLK